MSVIHTNINFLSQSKVSENLSDLIKEVLQANLPPSRVSKFPFFPSLCISREEESFEDKSFCAASGEERREMSGGKQYVSSIHSKKSHSRTFCIFQFCFSRIIASKVISNQNQIKIFTVIYTSSNQLLNVKKQKNFFSNSNLFVSK